MKHKIDVDKGIHLSLLQSRGTKGLPKDARRRSRFADRTRSRKYATQVGRPAFRGRGRRSHPSINDLGIGCPKWLFTLTFR
jgi:hypothetical protein